MQRIADAHLDLLADLQYRRHEPGAFAEQWLPGLRRGGVQLQVCPVWVTDPGHPPEATLRRSLEQIAAFQIALAECPDDVVEVRTRSDLAAVRTGERIGLMLSMEGVEPLGRDPGLFDLFWSLGVRMVGLTWAHRNAFADGGAEPGGSGVSRLGEQLLVRLAARRAIVDLAHLSDEGIARVLELTPDDTPLILSHAGCRAVHDISRNATDDQLRAIAERDGLFGLMLLPSVIHEDEATIERVVDHIDHAVGVMGIEHVALGGDFMYQLLAGGRATFSSGLELPDDLESLTIPGLVDSGDYQALAAALEARGYDATDRQAILSENLLRLLERALPE